MNTTFMIMGTTYTCEGAVKAPECEPEVKQPCIKVTAISESEEVSVYYVFGYEIPKTEAEFESMCGDTSAWES